MSQISVCEFFGCRQLLIFRHLIFRNESQIKICDRSVTGEGLKQKSDAEMLQIIADGKGKKQG